MSIEHEIDSAWSSHHRMVAGHRLEEYFIKASPNIKFWIVVAYYIEGAQAFPIKKKSFTTITVYESGDFEQPFFKKLCPDWVSAAVDDDAGIFILGDSQGVFNWDWDSRKFDQLEGWLLGKPKSIKFKHDFIIIDSFIAEVMISRMSDKADVYSIAINASAKFEFEHSFPYTNIPIFQNDYQVRWYGDYLSKLRDSAVDHIKQKPDHRVSKYVIDYCLEAVECIDSFREIPKSEIELKTVKSKLLDYFD